MAHGTHLQLVHPVLTFGLLFRPRLSALPESSGVDAGVEAVVAGVPTSIDASDDMVDENFDHGEC